MITIEKEYDNLVIQKKTLEKNLTIVMILVMAGLITFLATPAISKLLMLNSLTVGAIPTGCLIGSFIMAWRASKFLINKDKKIFFNHYSIYNFLKKFLTEKSDQSKIEVQNAIFDTILNIDKWIKLSTPSIISQLPISLSENLQKLSDVIETIETDEQKIIDEDINNEKYKELSEFNNTLYELVVKIFENTYTINDLQFFNSSFDKLQLTTSQKPSIKERLKIFYHKSIFYIETNPKLKFVFAPIVGLIIGLAILANNSEDTSLALSTGVVCGMMLLTSWSHILKNK